MTPIVVDASAALAWLLPTQATPLSRDFLQREQGPYFAPAVFAWEVGNVLVGRTQRGLIPSAIWPQVSAQWAALEITLADPVEAESMLPIALSHGLSLFDASYLALALELEAELVTRDAGLIRAARRRDLHVHDLRGDA